MYKQANTLSLTFIYRYSFYHHPVSITNNGIENYGAAESLLRAQKVQGPPYLCFHTLTLPLDTLTRSLYII